MIKQIKWVGLACGLLVTMAAASAVTVQAGQANDKTIVTFSQPVEVAGHVLPAGTYTFKLADSGTDRHIVQIFDALDSRLIATVMAVPTRRLKATDETVIRFAEVPPGSPDAIRAWFYPGNTIGQAFVYPKPLAAQLAKLANAPVPAIAADVTDPEALKTAPIVAITPDEKEIPVAAAVEMTPAPVDATPAPVTMTPAADAPPVTTLPSSPRSVVGTTGQAPAAKSAGELPKTATALPLISLLGVASIGAALLLMMVFGKRRLAPGVATRP